MKSCTLVFILYQPDSFYSEFGMTLRVLVISSGHSERKKPETSQQSVSHACDFYSRLGITVSYGQYSGEGKKDFNQDVQYACSANQKDNTKARAFPGGPSIIRPSFFFFLEVELIYSVVLITTVQQSDSVTRVYTFFSIFFSIWFITGY